VPSARVTVTVLDFSLIETVYFIVVFLPFYKFLLSVGYSLLLLYYTTFRGVCQEVFEKFFKIFFGFVQSVVPFRPSPLLLTYILYHIHKQKSIVFSKNFQWNLDVLRLIKGIILLNK
jgi:hypothetical protein